MLLWLELQTALQVYNNWKTKSIFCFWQPQKMLLVFQQNGHCLGKTIAAYHPCFLHYVGDLQRHHVVRSCGQVTLSCHRPVEALLLGWPGVQDWYLWEIHLHIISYDVYWVYLYVNYTNSSSTYSSTHGFNNNLGKNSSFLWDKVIPHNSCKLITKHCFRRAARIGDV